MVLIKMNAHQTLLTCLAGILILFTTAAAHAQENAGLRLVRYGPVGAEKPGLIDASGTLRDLSGQIDDITPQVISPAGLAELRAIDPSTLPEVEGKPRLGVPLIGIRQIPALARNYRAHALEGNFEVPEEPVLFFKSITSLNGPTDPVILPKGSVNSDFEVELGVVIGSKASYVGTDEAHNYVAGYLVCEDVTERYFQRELGGGNSKGKSAPTFTPLGPWLLTADGVDDVQDLNMWLDLNGERMIESNTSYMMSGALETVSYLSRFFTLLPGDVICSGTPEGVGASRNPPVSLKAGDIMTLGIDLLGKQTHEVQEYSEGELEKYGSQN
jgi:2-keto-4-pentenoate hydratase/2-oxohepta-3-ene-1,7-dioic acid hydratase in catechol pathway